MALPIIKLIAYNCNSMRQPATVIATGKKYQDSKENRSHDKISGFKSFRIQRSHFKFSEGTTKTYCAAFCASLALLAGKERRTANKASINFFGISLLGKQDSPSLLRGSLGLLVWMQYVRV